MEFMKPFSVSNGGHTLLKAELPSKQPLKFTYLKGQHSRNVGQELSEL
jgi:hypothetical protein